MEINPPNKWKKETKKIFGSDEGSWVDGECHALQKIQKDDLL